MGRISARYRERVETSPTDWKESRFVVATLAVVSTATFMGTVVQPLTTATLTAKLEALAPAADRIQVLEKALAESKTELAAANALAAEASAKTPFLPGSVYPVGLDNVRVGSTRDQVVEAFPSGKWVDDDYVSVHTGNPLFRSVTYYFSGEKKNRRVSMILFHLDSDSPLNQTSIRNRFSILFGPPTAVGKRGASWWKATVRETIELDAVEGYSVKPGGYVPYWAKQ